MGRVAGNRAGGDEKLKRPRKRPFQILAPQVGLEPTTLRLRVTLCFHTGADYLINFPKKVAGR